ncbi:hypothetical protein L873DRAFT_1907910 [Choiromyces venosus 120613-1]|uniref:VanZ-like domain-containing protein n=1 Tax=Choiromyces venosus 120613-1 TaxID=1336337 RepID=A0A3N4JLV0_9PEZI|nr:hypothetical protein L873DRAFT_1907910 [Choiromyces venosus 120613-1]
MAHDPGSIHYILGNRYVYSRSFDPRTLVRTPFAIAFILLSLFSLWLGTTTAPIPVNDKFLHYVVFFILTACFYWILDTSRRRVFNLSFFICTLFLSIFSEFLQTLLSVRKFDPWDILADIFGSLSALAICTWYHKRMLERKRQAKGYQGVAVDEGDELADLEAAIADGEFEFSADEAEEEEVPVAAKGGN